MKGLRQAYRSRVKKGEESAWRGKWENVFSGKQLDSVQEGDSRSFSHGSNRDQKEAQSSSLAPKARTQIDGRKPSKSFGLRRRESFWKKMAGKRAHISSKESVRIRRVIVGILPY